MSENADAQGYPQPASPEAPPARPTEKPNPASGLDHAAGEDSGDQAPSIGFLGKIELEASVELGRTTLSIGEVLSLVPGSVVHINKMLGDPVELVIKDKLIARGEVVVVDDRFGLRISELASGSKGETSR